MKVKDFDWNHGNKEKIKKHGINSSEIEDFFLNFNPFIFTDQMHSDFEARFIAFGKHKRRNIFVVFTFRALEGSLKIRVISARYAHAKEAEKFYEKKINKEKNY